MGKNIICKDNRGGKYPTPLAKLRFRPSAYAVIIDRGKVLLSRQWDGFDLPGGGIDLGEGIEAALRREVWEETGFRIKTGGIVSAAESFYRFHDKDKHGGRFAHCIMLYYRCRIVGGKKSIANLDDSEKKYAGYPEWVALADLPRIKFYNSLGKRKLIGIIKQGL